MARNPSACAHVIESVRYVRGKSGGDGQAESELREKVFEWEITVTGRRVVRIASYCKGQNGDARAFSPKYTIFGQRPVAAGSVVPQGD
jgi:hypothetical protein